MYSKETNSIRRTSQLGLWGSVSVVILAALFLYASPWRIPPQNDYWNRMALIIGSVAVVLVVSVALMQIRKRLPLLRQAESLQAKLSGYANHVRTIFLSIFAVVVIICLLAILTSQSVLIMLAIVSTLVLFLAFPNIYKIKLDLSLTDQEMHSLFADRYIGGDNA